MDRTTRGPVDTAAAYRTALRLQAVTVAWMVVEAAVALGAGIVVRSLLLAAFGVDSIIELVSAFLVTWQLRHEARSQAEGARAMGAFKETVSRWAGYLLYALAIYVTV